MKSSKVMAALVTLGLAAAVATPAMALENQVSGAFTSFFDLSNYSAVGNGGEAASTNATGLAKNAKTENYFVQRVNLNYTAKANEDVKLVTRFELDYTFYGNNSYTNQRNGGGALGADGINLETKNLYLDLNVGKGLNAKIGMQGNTDSFKGIIFDADMAGVLLTHEYSNASASVGFFRLNDSNSLALGKHTYDILALDGKYSVNKNIKVGAAYYYMNDTLENGTSEVTAATTTTTTPSFSYVVVDNLGVPRTITVPAVTITTPAVTTPKYNKTKVHTLGLNAEGTVGPITVSGFALTQFGDISNTKKAKGYAFNIGAKMPVANGTARTEFLYTAGGNNSLHVIAPTEGGGFYDNEMVLLGRDKNAKTLDTAIAFDANNIDQGLIFGSVGYDYPITAKLSGSVNAGFAAVTKSTGANKSDYLGTEFNCEANYKLMPTVTLGARAGYVVLGDYFKGNNFDNPYDVKLIAKFAF